MIAGWSSKARPGEVRAKEAGRVMGSEWLTKCRRLTGSCSHHEEHGHHQEQNFTCAHCSWLLDW